MSLPTYTSVAKQLGIPWCRGIKANGQRCFGGHRPGFIYDGQVHFADRRESRAGIRRFLYLGATLAVAEVEPGWRRYYRANRLVTDWIKVIRVEMPRSTTAPYKTQMKAMLAGVEPGDPVREEAWLWASR